MSSKISEERTIIGEFKYDESEPQEFKDLLDGKYNKHGYEVYRVFRDENKKILKIVFIKDGVFIERDPEHVLNNTHFEENEFK